MVHPTTPFEPEFFRAVDPFFFYFVSILSSNYYILTPPLKVWKETKMAQTTFEIREGATKLAFEARSWFAKDVIVQLSMVLDRIDKINVKDLVDFRVNELGAKHLKDVERLKAEIGYARKQRDEYYERSQRK